jgi:hypothetical protein
MFFFSGAWGKIIHDKNLKQNISWPCPFRETHAHGLLGNDSTPISMSASTTREERLREKRKVDIFCMVVYAGEGRGTKSNPLRRVRSWVSLKYLSTLIEQYSYLHCKKDPIYEFPEIKLRSLSPIFYIHIYLWAIDIFPRSFSLFCWSQIGSQIYEWKNWDWGPRSFLSGNMFFLFSVQFFAEFSGKILELFLKEKPVYWCACPLRVDPRHPIEEHQQNI